VFLKYDITIPSSAQVEPLFSEAIKYEYTEENRLGDTTMLQVKKLNKHVS